MEQAIRETVGEAAAFVQNRSDVRPDVALILGSGLGSIADMVEDPVAVEAGEIPHMGASTVEGHRGRLVLGRLGGKNAAVVQGRLHMYEGHGLNDVLFPVRLVRALGCTCLFVTNAAGGIRSDFRPGTLMWITDHINWTGERVTDRTADTEAAVRIRTSATCYDEYWTERCAEMATAEGIATQAGTYLWTRGPSYETRAEIRAFRRLGADAVGMSTVPEVIEAFRLGMHVVGLSTITNLAAGLSDRPLNHEEVIETGNSVRSSLERLAQGVVRLAPAE